MTSPNEPGAPPSGRSAESSDVPPWQRGPAARAGAPRPAEQANGPRPAEHANGPRPPEQANGPRPADAARPPARSPGPDARIGQFIAGGPGAGTRDAGPANRDTEVVPTRTAERTEGQRPENYASELPDLSAPTSRPPRPSGNPAPAETRPASRVQVAKKSHGPVRASMQIRRIDPWSTLKVSLVLSGVMFFVWMIAVAFLYLVLGGMGVWTKLNSNVGDLLTSDSGTGGELISSGTIFGGATLIGLLNIVLLTAMATAGAFIYNLTTDLVGGVEVTLADRD
ncbi:DUF3566 domain-containing protein [Mycolicibacterium diernhoferi]|uniref:DUF3566 domain-containing protein n=1 Tax=Mycolicibacterium diernhoferi TaxID=1801 RepID=A0A1Q4H8C3_9MYCO|nr:hypothetical protein BRW64_21560 [Mycolicibacterium diernhoferi]OPE54544.1 hypothetical protein BV510_09795 [Mycolicibacterium diernhoferi]PEG53756.1 hypothetical protein CRI78_14210 [Mycolicibacterium diernhoferi]QYL22798.1 DUF3566 domain-containing protein [Mycolicibacterium diernhoferi]